MEYFVLQGRETEGPFSEDELRRAVDSGQFGPDDLARTEESRFWTPLRRILKEEPARSNVTLPPLPSEARREERGALNWRESGNSMLDLVRRDPLRAGLICIGIACAIAFASRWPILLALPAISVGVYAGIQLILRNRPILGGVISLAAILLPLALLPWPRPGTRAVPGQASSATITAGAGTAASRETPAAPATASIPSPAAPSGDAAKAGALAPSAPGPAATPVPASSPLAPATAGTLPPPSAAAVVRPNLNVPLPARAEDVVYVIDTGKSRGSGFIAGYGDKVYFFTNHHVLQAAEKISIRGGLQPPQSLGGIIEVAADRDLVRFPLEERPALRFATAARYDEPIAAFGDSSGRGVLTPIGGKVLRVGPGEIEVNAGFAPGNSGGPILNAADEVLGIATYLQRGENLASWIKSGTRFTESRRVALRVTEDVRWERMLFSAYQASSTRIAEMEAILAETVGFANQLAQKPFRNEITTRFPQRADLRNWVETYNNNARGRIMPNEGKMRDYARRLIQTIDNTRVNLQTESQSGRVPVSKGYLKQREDELLRTYAEVSAAIARHFDVQI